MPTDKNARSMAIAANTAATTAAAAAASVASTVSALNPITRKKFPDGAGKVYESDFSSGNDGWSGVGITITRDGSVLVTTANSGMTGQGPWIERTVAIPAGAKIKIRVKAVSGGAWTARWPQVAVKRASDNVEEYILQASDRPLYKYEPDGFETITLVNTVAAQSIRIRPTGTATEGDVCQIEKILIGDLKYAVGTLSERGASLASKIGDVERFGGSVKGIWDYQTAIDMPPDLLREVVETSTAGKCTVLFDDLGQPSLMFVIPAMSMSMLHSDLGDAATLHPAFVVGGVAKKKLFVGCYQSTLVNGRMVSWPGLFATGGVTIPNVKAACSAKGAGWHMLTAYERGLINWLTKKVYGEPRGNTYYGRSHVSGYEAECGERLDCLIPGTNNSGGPCVRHGSGPESWAHNKSAFGIHDLVGNYWEFIDLIKLVDGQIYMAADNDYGLAESSWSATGAFIDVSGEQNVLSNSVTSSPGSIVMAPLWKNLTCTAGFDTLSASVRKQLLATTITPKLTSAATPSIQLEGMLWTKNSGTCYAMGSAASEYGSGCGLGALVMAYGTTDAHGNMGSRLAYIEP